MNSYKNNYSSSVIELPNNIDELSKDSNIINSNNNFNIVNKDKIINNKQIQMQQQQQKQQEQQLEQQQLEQPKLSPILAEGMRYGLLIEFLLISISLVQYIFNFNWLEDNVCQFYPLNKYYNLFLFTIIFNGLVSTWKGYKVDGKLFFAGHHFLTMVVIFWSMYPYGAAETRFFFYVINYLTMRLVKRIKDDGYMTKDQWVTFYVSYAYFQTVMGVTIMSLYPKSLNAIDMIGSLAHLDSLITCRKENFGGKLLNDSTLLIPINWLVDKKYKLIQNILSVLDVASLWSIIILSSKVESNIFINLLKYIVPFALLEFGIKPLFKNFTRPYTYKFSNHSSFPSSHSCICGIIVCCLSSLSPIQRLLSVVLMGFYRVYTRAHTIEDVCAGIAMTHLFVGFYNFMGF